jgi:ABC-type transport system involved in cytochrome bd biosynthesis fused ATPase/permease subunit
VFKGQKEFYSIKQQLRTWSGILLMENLLQLLRQAFHASSVLNFLILMGVAGVTFCNGKECDKGCVQTSATVP